MLSGVLNSAGTITCARATARSAFCEIAPRSNSAIDRAGSLCTINYLRHFELATLNATEFGLVYDIT